MIAHHIFAALVIAIAVLAGPYLLPGRQLQNDASAYVTMERNG